MAKVVMISGASRGIGKAIAQRLFAGGWHLSLGLRSPCNLELSNEPEKVLECRYEARDHQSAQNWVNNTLRRFGRIDALVNNAGVLRPLYFEGEQDDDDQLQEMWEVNCLGPWKLSRLVFPHLIKTGGRIVNIVSVSGKRATVPEESGYCVSKFAAMGVSEVMRAAGANVGVGVTAICPGWVNTGMVDLKEAKQAVQPTDVAHTVAHVLSLPSRVVVSEIILDDALPAKLDV